VVIPPNCGFLPARATISVGGCSVRFIAGGGSFLFPFLHRTLGTPPAAVFFLRNGPRLPAWIFFSTLPSRIPLSPAISRRFPVDMFQFFPLSSCGPLIPPRPGFLCVFGDSSSCLSTISPFFLLHSKSSPYPMPFFPGLTGLYLCQPSRAWVRF